MNCPQCKEKLANSATACECGWREGPAAKPQKLCQYCNAPIVWTNGRSQVCLKHYDEYIYPQVVATKTDIEFHKKLRDVEAWIDKHPEFKTKREACLSAIKAKGLKLPASLSAESDRAVKPS